MGGGGSIEEDPSKYNSSNYHINGQSMDKMKANKFMTDFFTQEHDNYKLNLATDLGINPKVPLVTFSGLWNPAEYNGVKIYHISINAMQGADQVVHAGFVEYRPVTGNYGPPRTTFYFGGNISGDTMFITVANEDVDKFTKLIKKR